MEFPVRVANTWQADLFLPRLNPRKSGERRTFILSERIIRATFARKTKMVESTTFIGGNTSMHYFLTGSEGGILAKIRKSHKKN